MNKSKLEGGRGGKQMQTTQKAKGFEFYKSDMTLPKHLAMPRSPDVCLSFQHVKNLSTFIYENNLT